MPTDSVGKGLTKGIQHLTDSLQNIAPKSLGDIKEMDWSAIGTGVMDMVVRFGIKLVIAIVVFLVGRFIIKKLHNVLRAILLAHDVDRSLSSFLLSLFNITLLFILIVVVVSIVGIETSSFIAIFASAGFAVGMALSGTLQNFAGGVLILLLKPYKVGDFIEFQTHKGVVREIQIFHTVITTLNNEAIIIPNGGLSTGTVNNYTREKMRRVEWRVGISYGDSVDTARKVIMAIFAAEEKILKPGADGEQQAADGDASVPQQEPITDEEVKRLPWYKRLFHHHRKIKAKAVEWREERKREIEKKAAVINVTPSVAVEALNDSAVTLVARAWVLPENYWAVLYAVNEDIYKQLPENGINFPFPQLDVHFDKND